eukprot:m.22686 g.22686  ORF g.22686 m.22686 type:complete len:481 (+) comp11284_c0_seq1:134-1576(+)
MSGRLAQLQVAVAAYLRCSLDEILQLDLMTQLKLMVEARLISNASMELLAHCHDLEPAQAQEHCYKHSTTSLLPSQSRGLPVARTRDLCHDDNNNNSSQLPPQQQPSMPHSIVNVDPPLSKPSSGEIFSDGTKHYGSTTYHNLSFQCSFPSPTVSYTCTTATSSTAGSVLQAFAATDFGVMKTYQPGCTGGVSPALTFDTCPNTRQAPIDLSTTWNQDQSTLALDLDQSWSTISTTAIDGHIRSTPTGWEQQLEDAIERCSDPFTASLHDTSELQAGGNIWQSQPHQPQKVTFLSQQTTYIDTPNHISMQPQQRQPPSALHEAITSSFTLTQQADLVVEPADGVDGHRQCQAIDTRHGTNMDTPSLSQRAGSSPQRKRNSTGRRKSAEIDCNERRRVANMSPTQLQHVRQLAREASRRRKYKERQSMKQLQHAVVELEVEQRGLLAELRTLEGERHRLYQYVVQQRSRPGTKSSNLHTYI